MDLGAWQAAHDAELRAKVEPLLAFLHEIGWHEGPGSPTLTGARHPVVADANVLRNDIRRRAISGRDTILLTAGARTLRLYCAEHVIDEVYEHAYHWADDRVPGSQLLQTFENRYLPLVHVVQPPDGLVTGGEQQRLDALMRIDPDDVPSVTLAILLGAFYLSEDGPACDAAYGGTRARDELRGWLDVLRSGSDERQLTQATHCGAQIGGVATALLMTGARTVARKPAVAIAALTAIAFTTLNWNPSNTAIARRFGGELLTMTGAMSRVIQMEGQAFRRACVPQPTQEELLDELTAKAVLTRAMIAALGTGGAPDASAAELSERLWPLAVPHGAAVVRAVLRSHICFEATARGRWRLDESTRVRTFEVP